MFSHGEGRDHFLSKHVSHCCRLNAKKWLDDMTLADQTTHTHKHAQTVFVDQYCTLHARRRKEWGKNTPSESIIANMAIPLEFFLYSTHFTCLSACWCCTGPTVWVSYSMTQCIQGVTRGGETSNRLNHGHRQQTNNPLPAVLTLMRGDCVGWH